jgi:hypothetical protein
MTKDGVLFGYRLQLFAEAARTTSSWRMPRTDTIPERPSRGCRCGRGTS